MTIKIAAKLRPFSHVPGAACVIPGTSAVIEAFPTLLRIDGHEITLNLTGPVKDFYPSARFGKALRLRLRDGQRRVLSASDRWGLHSSGKGAFGK